MTVYQAYAPAAGVLEVSSGFKTLFEQLTESAGPGRIPGRKDVDPTAITRYLPMINLVDVVPGMSGFRLRYRLVGSMQQHYFAEDKNVTGKFLDEYWSDDVVARVRILGDYVRALKQRGPVCSEFAEMEGRFSYLSFSRAIFPLATDGQSIDSFVCMHHYQHSEKMTDHMSRHPLSRSSRELRAIGSGHLPRTYP
jgi:hypothetical protein